MNISYVKYLNVYLYLHLYTQRFTFVFVFKKRMNMYFSDEFENMHSDMIFVLFVINISHCIVEKSPPPKKKINK